MTHVRNLLQTTWRQVYNSFSVTIPIQDYAEQRRLSWARTISSYAEAPPVYKAFFEPLQESGQAFPYTVVTPTFEGFLNPTTEKVICDVGQEVFVLKKIGSSFEVYCYPLEAVNYVEMRTVLLDSHIKLSGVTGQGVLSSATCKFNTVTDHLFTPILNRIRCVAGNFGDAAPRSETANFGQWLTLNYKFMNFARRSVLAGETVIQAVLQPEIRAKIFTFLGRTVSRKVASTHATILTNRELILIREEEGAHADSKYSGIWDYVPLNRIESLSVSEKENGLLVLSIHLPANDRLEQVFQASARSEVDQLMRQYKELTAA